MQREGSSSEVKKQKEEQILQTRVRLDETIEQLNDKLQGHFRRKEAQLMEQYKQELMQAQKELNELKSNTNEQQIKARMMERKKELERERHELIQTNIFFSSKCENYKTQLSQAIAEGQELERELLFLDAQINHAHQQRYQHQKQMSTEPKPPQQQQQQQQSPPALPLFSERKPASEASSQPRKMTNSVSMRNNTNPKKTIIEEALAGKQKQNLARKGLPAEMSGSALEKSPLQELFEGVVESVKERRKGKKVMPILRGEQFSDLQKRTIMEQFLSKQQVKRKIYEIIFEAEEKQPPMAGSFQPVTSNGAKVKISFEDIS